MPIELQHSPRLATFQSGDYRRRFWPVGLGSFNGETFSYQDLRQSICHSPRAQRRTWQLNQGYRRVEQAFFVDSPRYFFNHSIIHHISPFAVAQISKKKGLPPLRL
jgi:hypothetical protein